MTGKHSSVQRRQTLKAYGFMTPALIIIILFTIIPIIGSLVLMFYDYSVLGQTKFVGLKNFVKAFHDIQKEFRILTTDSLAVLLAVGGGEAEYFDLGDLQIYQLLFFIA